MVIVIEPSYEFLSNTTSGSELEIMRQIERAGRVAYKSENRITDDSAKPFTQMIIKRNHGSVLEHNSIVLRIPNELYHLIKQHEDNGEDGMPCFFRFTHDQHNSLISGNVRSFRSFHTYFGKLYPELRCIGSFLADTYPTLFGDLPDLKCENVFKIELVTEASKFTNLEQLRHITVTVKLICDRGFTHEVVRNKQFITFTQESTRYNLYNSEKFGWQIMVIRPCELTAGTPAYDEWFEGMQDDERHYFKLTSKEQDMGISAQIARGNLGNSLKTEIVITATLWEWREIFKQRADPAAHPQMRQLMIPLLRDFTVIYPHIFNDIAKKLC